jgi:transcriptional regulator with XRE-family HTH domain
VVLYSFTSETDTVRSEADKRLRQLLVDARQRADLTQAELSRRLNRPQSFVSKYERGERRLDVIEFGQVARAIGLDPLRFLRQFYRETP